MALLYYAGSGPRVIGSPSPFVALTAMTLASFFSKLFLPPAGAKVAVLPLAVVTYAILCNAQSSLIPSNSMKALA